MSSDDSTSVAARSGLRHHADEDFAGSPGREADIAQIVFAQFGVQGPTAESGTAFIAELRRLFTQADGPRVVERCHHRDAAGYYETILMAYWLDTAAFRQWLDRPEVLSWWRDLPSQGELGFWREILTPDADRFGFLGFGLSGKRRFGCTHAAASKPSGNWGYWGGYRDRFAASKTDHFESDFLAEIAPVAGRVTRGKRLRIHAPDNLCFVREGADTSTVVDPRERDGWETRVKPVFQKFVAYLRDNPSLSGAIALRDTIEQNVETGADFQKHNTLIYFLSLRHMERAARTQPSHLALYHTYMEMLDQLGAAEVSSELLVWAEAHILPRGSGDFEYVNCHERTGLLAYFPIEEIQ